MQKGGVPSGLHRFCTQIPLHQQGRHHRLIMAVCDEPAELMETVHASILQEPCKLPI
jgi:hypothetical protein